MVEVSGGGKHALGATSQRAPQLLPSVHFEGSPVRDVDQMYPVLRMLRPLCRDCEGHRKA